MSNAMDETDDVLWNSSAEKGNVKTECEEDEGTECVKMETVTLIGKGR